ncbi:MAG: FkbM family methyltransferase, partial [Chitinophagaceae bacterium]
KQNLPLKFHLLEYGIGNKTGSFNFYLPRNPVFVSGSILVQNNIDVHNKISVNVKSISDICYDLGHEQIDVLKMDIEGSEYEVIEDILQSKIIINQILIEFHDRFFKDGKAKSRKIVGSLHDHGYEIFALSPSGEEVSFIKKSLLFDKQ